jgi:outer membrane protein OmpA-like peptidoglycan-associated protein
MSDAFARPLLFLALSKFVVAENALAAVNQPSLHPLRKEMLRSLAPDTPGDTEKPGGSSVRLVLRNGSLTSVKFRIEKTDACGTDMDDPREEGEKLDSPAELRPTVYQLVVNAAGFATQTFCFIALSQQTSTLQIGARDDELVVTQILDIEQPTFEKSRSRLKKESYPQLAQVVEILKENPRILRMELAVHTDSGGTHAANMKLTKGRAEALRTYMLRQGIDAQRLEAEGYGSLQPLVDSRQPDAKQINRRVEFILRGLAARSTPLIGKK